VVTLYYSPGACSLAPHIVLEESGTAFEAKRVPITEGAHRTPDFLAINPHGRLPTLEVDGAVVTENLAVLTYVASSESGAGALPRNRLQLARVYELLSFFASSVHIAFAQVWRPERFTEDPALHDSIREAGRGSVRRCFDEIEAMLVGREWLVGGRFTVADTYPFVFYRWGRRIEIGMDAYPNWTVHTARMLGRPSVHRALAREGLSPSEFLPERAAA
jgi:glutathione S-transferase